MACSNIKLVYAWPLVEPIVLIQQAAETPQSSAIERADIDVRL